MQSEIRLARSFAERRESARAYLWREMNARGLLQRDGWGIVEITRDTVDGTELVMRPIHRFLPSPDGLECVVEIHEEDEVVDSHCDPAIDGGAARV